MEEKLLELGYRNKILQQITATENNERMTRSLEATEVYQGAIFPYVYKNLQRTYNSDSPECPVVSSINVAEKTVNSLASIYTDEPEREFLEVSDNQKEILGLVYEDMSIDSKMQNSNRYFKLQKQNHLIIEPKNGKLILRDLKQHQINVVVGVDPEEATVYIISAYNKSDSTSRKDQGNGVNEEIGDVDDYKIENQRHVWWSKSYHFVTDGHGKILTEEIDNPITPIVPIVDIAEEKDFAYFLDFMNNISDFCVQLNEMLSNNMNVVKMQGFAQAYLKAPESLMPQSVTIGPTKLLKLITNPNMEGDVEFGFANTGADLAEIRESVESLLSMFLSSMGVDPTAVSGKAQTTKYSSGVEKLLAMIDDFKASKSDFAKYKTAEKQVFKIVIAWLNALKETDQLDDKYKSELFTENAQLNISFHSPELTLTESDKLDIIERKIEMGIMDRVGAIESIEGLTTDQAKEKLKSMRPMAIDLTGAEGVN